LFYHLHRTNIGTLIQKGFEPMMHQYLILGHIYVSDTYRVRYFSDIYQ